MFEKLNGAKRLLVEAELEPVQGERFQPTGFADLGAATYRLADGTRMLLVESAQSMANRLESTIIGPDNELMDEFDGLPYVRVKLSGDSDSVTNSLIEAHRINSPYIISDKKFQELFKKEANYDKYKPLNWKKIARALFKYDVNSVLHGAFLANLEDGRIKMPRAVSAFIEAKNVMEAVSGGVKNNPIDPTGKMRAVGYGKDVYGNVPYQRVEFTADQIKVFFNIDVGLLQSYDLGQDAFELLLGLALYKIRAFLDSGTRLRTACDFKLKNDLIVTEPDGFVIPSKEDLLKHVKTKSDACEPMFASPPVTELETKVVVKKGADKEEAE